MCSEMFTHIWARSRHALIPALVALALCLPGSSQGAFSTDTAWYTAIASQAWQGAGQGDPGALWTLKGVAGQPYFNKPPLGFWLNGGPLAVFGASILAARLGSIAACVLCVLSVARLGRLLAGRAVGLAAGLVLALTWEFVRHSHAFSLDLWLTLFLTLAACSTADANLSNRPQRLAIAGCWLGLALMVKPLVPLLAIPLLGIWLLFIGRACWLGWLLAAAAVSLAVAAPWHLSMWLMHGDAFTSQYFGREIIDRAASGPVADFNKGSDSPFYYVGVLLGAYWPWLATFAMAIVAFARREGNRRERTALAFSLIWCAGWLVLLSVFPDKRPRYLLLVYPIAALASAVLLTRLAPIQVRAVWARVSVWSLPITAAAALTLCLAPIRIHRADPPQWGALYSWLIDHGSPALYAGGFAPQRSAQVFLGTGAWPIPTRTVGGAALADPPVGVLVIYHRRDGLAPGTNETTVFSDGDLIVTRLTAAPWAPVATPDPGERP